MRRVLVLTAVLGTQAYVSREPITQSRRITLVSRGVSQLPDTDTQSKEDLETLAEQLNPRIKFFDPLKLADQNFWGTSNSATIGFLRAAEMKHGRIAMLGFLGWCLQGNHIHFPWATPENGFPPSELSPPDQWDVLDPGLKLQLFLVIGLLEIWSEYAGVHYMRGGKPGKFPSFLIQDGNIRFAIDLWDPMNLTKDMTPATKERKLAKEINNGRLAMLGMFGFVVESKIKGAVPLLTYLNIVEPYEGEYVTAFGYWDVILYCMERSQWLAGTSSGVEEIVPW